MITAGTDIITRAAQAAIEADKITALRPAIVGAPVISTLQVGLTDWLPMVETDLSTSSPVTRWSRNAATKAPSAVTFWRRGASKQ